MRQDPGDTYAGLYHLTFSWVRGPIRGSGSPRSCRRLTSPWSLSSRPYRRSISWRTSRPAWRRSWLHTTDIPELRLHFIIFFAFLPKNSDHDDHVILEIRDLSMYFISDFNRHFCNTVKQETDPFQCRSLRRFSFLIRNELAVLL